MNNRCGCACHQLRQARTRVCLPSWSGNAQLDITSANRHGDSEAKPCGSACRLQSDPAHRSARHIFKCIRHHLMAAIIMSGIPASGSDFSARRIVLSAHSAESFCSNVSRTSQPSYYMLVRTFEIGGRYVSWATKFTLVSAVCIVNIDVSCCNSLCCNCASAM